jgi:hypothetical protein
MMAWDPSNPRPKMTWTQFIAKQKAKMQAEESAAETDVSDSE